MKIIWNKVNSYPLFKDNNGKTKMVIPLGKREGGVGQEKEAVVGFASQIMKKVIEDIRNQFNDQIIP